MRQFKMKTFSDFESTDDKVKSRHKIATVKYNKMIALKSANLKEMIDLDLRAGFQCRFVTNQSFNAVVAIDAIAQKYDIKKIVIVVYRMNLRTVDRMKQIINDGISVTILLSSFFRENKRYEKWCEELVAFCADREQCIVAFSWSHAKVVLVKTLCGKHIVFEGSGNLSDNARIEQYLIENNKMMYDFHLSWIMEEINE